MHLVTPNVATVQTAIHFYTCCLTTYSYCTNCDTFLYVLFNDVQLLYKLRYIFKRAV
jgi:hypothetical protein